MLVLPLDYRSTFLITAVQLFMTGMIAVPDTLDSQKPLIHHFDEILLTSKASRCKTP
jgi:hypothetical protein